MCWDDGKRGFYIIIIFIHKLFNDSKSVLLIISLLVKLVLFIICRGLLLRLQTNLVGLKNKNKNYTPKREGLG